MPIRNSMNCFKEKETTYLIQLLFYWLGTISFSIYLINEIKDKIQDYNFRKHALKQINKFEKETGMDYLSYQEKKFDEVIEEACKNQVLQ